MDFETFFEELGEPGGDMDGEVLVVAPAGSHLEITGIDINDAGTTLIMTRRPGAQP